MRSAFGRSIVVFMVISATTLVGLLLPAASGAASINGNPLTIAADGVGNMQVHLAGSANGELEPASAGLATGAGLCLLNGSVLAGPCGTTASNITPPVTSGSGTPGDPYLLTTTYSVDVVDSKLEVTQTFQYVNGDSLFRATYAIENTGASQPVRVLVQGNLDHAGSPLGQGGYDPSPTPDLFGFNDARGSFGGLLTATTPWDAYQEASIVSLPLMNALSPDGLTNTVDSSLADDWVGVQFDQYTTSGLPSGQTYTVDVYWEFGDYAGLALSPSATSLQTGQTETITATSLDHGVPVTGVPVRYTIAGANPGGGASLTGPDGNAAIVLTGAHAGADVVTAYVDVNGDGVYDSHSETLTQARITWTAPSPSPSAPPSPPAAALSTQAPRSVVRARLQTALAALVHRLRGHSTASLLKTPAPRVSFTAPEAGVLAVTLARRSRSSRSAAAAVILAAARKSYARPRKAVASLRPTAAGRRVLRHTRRVAASVKLVFTPKAGGTPIATQRALTLGR